MSKIKENEGFHLNILSVRMTATWFGIEHIKPSFTNTVKKYVDDYKFNRLKVLARKPYKPKYRIYKSKNNIEFIL